MGKIVTNKVDFTTGIVGNHLKGRLNAQQYDSGMEALENFDVVPQGPIKKRRGSVLVAELDTIPRLTDRSGRLIPFQFNEDVAFIIVATHKRFQIFDKATNERIADVTTPYSVEQLEAIQYMQYGNRLYLTHPNHAPATLDRRVGDSFVLQDVLFTVPPNTEFGRDNVTVTAITVLDGTATLTVGTDEALDVDVGRIAITPEGGQLTVTRRVNNTTLEARVDRSVPEIAPFNMDILGTPVFFLEITTTNGGIGTGSLVTLTAKDAPEGTPITAFEPNQTGLLFVNGGIIDMGTGNVVDGTTLENCQIIESLTVSDGTFGFTFAKPEFGDGNYPQAVATYSGRLCFGGTGLNPQKVWISKAGSFDNFAEGVAADDGFSVDLISTRSSKISWMSPDRDLVVGCAGVEISVGSTTNDPFTPATAQQRTRTSYGSSPQQPVRVNNQTLFIRSGERKLSSYGYSYQIDGYDGADLTFLADDIAEGKSFIETTYINTPEPRIYSVLGDGTLAVAAYLNSAQQQLIGWSKYTTDGFFVSCQGLSERGEDRVYSLVNREVQNTNGTTSVKMMLEEFSLINEADDSSIFLDSSYNENIMGLAEGTTTGSATATRAQVTQRYFQPSEKSSLQPNPATGTDVNTFPYLFTGRNADGNISTLALDKPKELVDLLELGGVTVAVDGNAINEASFDITTTPWVAVTDNAVTYTRLTTFSGDTLFGLVRQTWDTPNTVNHDLQVEFQTTDGNRFARLGWVNSAGEPTQHTEWVLIRNGSNERFDRLVIVTSKIGNQHVVTLTQDGNQLFTATLGAPPKEGTPDKVEIGFHGGFDLGYIDTGSHIDLAEVATIAETLADEEWVNYDPNAPATPPTAVPRNGVEVAGYIPREGQVVRFPTTGTVTVNYTGGQQRQHPLKDITVDGVSIAGGLFPVKSYRYVDSFIDIGEIGLTNISVNDTINDITIGVPIEVIYKVGDVTSISLPRFRGKEVSVKSSTGQFVTVTVGDDGTLPFTEADKTSTIVAGLAYTVKATTLPLNVELQEGNAVTQMGRAVNITAKVFNSTTQFQFNGFDVPQQMVSPDNLNLFSGDLQLGASNFNERGIVLDVESTTPFPLTILGFYGEMKGNIK